MCLCPNTNSIFNAFYDGGRYYSQTQAAWVCTRCYYEQILPAEWLEAVEQCFAELKGHDVAHEFKKVRRQLRKQLEGRGGPVPQESLRDTMGELIHKVRRRDEEKAEDERIANTRLGELGVVMFAGTRELCWDDVPLREAAEAEAWAVFDEYRDALNMRITPDQNRLSAYILPCAVTGSTYVKELYDRLYKEAKAKLPYNDPWSVP